jgi:hypothetical protein
VLDDIEEPSMVSGPYVADSQYRKLRRYGSGIILFRSRDADD